MSGAKRGYVPCGTAEITGCGGLLPSLLVYTTAGRRSYDRLFQACRRLGIGLDGEGEDTHTPAILAYRVYGTLEELYTLVQEPWIEGYELWTAVGRQYAEARDDGSIRGQKLGRKRTVKPPAVKADLPYAQEAIITECSGHLLRERTLYIDDSDPESIPPIPPFQETPLPSLDRHTFRQGEGI